MPVSTLRLPSAWKAAAPVLLVSTMLAQPAALATEAPSSAALARNQPAEVAAYLERRAGCNHWSGEEGYDAPRKAEIDKALRDLKCAAIDRDDRNLRARYARSPEVLKALDQVRDLDN